VIKAHGIHTPKTIIFCDTIYAIANVANYMMMQLGCSAFHPLSSTNRENCLIGIIHSATQKEYKTRLLQSLKGEGTERIAIATTLLSMGVNFSNIRYIVMFGLPRSMLDLHQEAGRGGRDGLPTDVRICFYGQQVSHCDDDVRDFVNATGCLRVAAYSSFDANIVPSLTAHQCCSFCSKTCFCSQERCPEPIKRFEQTTPENHLQQQPRTRHISNDDKKVLEESLQELVKGMFSSTMSPFGATSIHEFSQELICDVVANCHNIFTQEDLFILPLPFPKIMLITSLVF
jgi:superfamily II DNA helicase RecQ